MNIKKNNNLSLRFLSVLLLMFVLFPSYGRLFAYEIDPLCFESTSDVISDSDWSGGRLASFKLDGSGYQDLNSPNGGLIVSDWNGGLLEDFYLVHDTLDIDHTDYATALGSGTMDWNVTVEYGCDTPPDPEPEDVNSDPFLALVNTIYNASIWGSFVGLLLVFFGKKS